jgi:hypothetical protein
MHETSLVRQHSRLIFVLAVLFIGNTAALIIAWFLNAIVIVSAILFTLGSALLITKIYYNNKEHYGLGFVSAKKMKEKNRQAACVTWRAKKSQYRLFYTPLFSVRKINLHCIFLRVAFVLFFLFFSFLFFFLFFF